MLECVVYGFFSLAYCMFRVTEPFRVVFIPAMSRVRFLKFSSTFEAVPVTFSIIFSRASPKAPLTTLPIYGHLISIINFRLASLK